MDPKTRKKTKKTDAKHAKKTSSNKREETPKKK